MSNFVTKGMVKIKVLDLYLFHCYICRYIFVLSMQENIAFLGIFGNHIDYHRLFLSLLCVLVLYFSKLIFNSRFLHLKNNINRHRRRRRRHCHRHRHIFVNFDS